MEMSDMELENERIRQVIAKYKDYFKYSRADVGHTEKNIWFFYEYDEEHRYYDSFIRFRTAKDLERLIAGLIADDLNVLIETAVENADYALQEFDMSEAAKKDYDACIPELLRNMEVLNRECEKNMGKLEVIFKSLSGILNGLQTEHCKKI